MDYFPTNLPQKAVKLVFVIISVYFLSFGFYLKSDQDQTHFALLTNLTTKTPEIVLYLISTAGFVLFILI